MKAAVNVLIAKIKSVIKRSNIEEMLRESRWRMVSVVFGVICLMWFWAPLTLAGILNLGNVTGITLSLMLILYGIFMSKVHNQVRKMWSKRRGRVLLSTVGVLAIICASLVMVESCCMIGASIKRGTENATAIVLGCRVYGERASQSLRERLEAAYEYLVEHPEADCVVSGGKGDGEDISEAECMYRWLVEKGIDPSRIYKEDQSTSTEENKPIFKI